MLSLRKANDKQGVQMKRIRRNARLIAVAVTCVGAGAGVSAIATAGAATPNKQQAAKAGPLIRASRRAVSGDLVVPTKTGFAHVTFERGIVKSVSGQQLTIAEGTRAKTYKTVTVTIPSNAKVRDNGKPATLAGVAVGQRALVVQAPKRTFVIARTPR
jgi:hypothetical protein